MFLILSIKGKISFTQPQMEPTCFNLFNLSLETQDEFLGINFSKNVSLIIFSMYYTWVFQHFHNQYSFYTIQHYIILKITNFYGQLVSCRHMSNSAPSLQIFFFSFLAPQKPSNYFSFEILYLTSSLHPRDELTTT